MTILLSHIEPSTHPSLLIRAQAGNPEGWTMLVQVYGPIVYRWLRRSGVQSADAADIMQDTFLCVTTALARFDATAPGSSFRGWLWRIARNKLRDRQRRRQTEGWIDGSEAERLIDQAVDNPVAITEPPSSLTDDLSLVQTQMLEVLRASFDSRSWQMFWQTAVNGRTAADVAEEMGVTHWAVYKAKSRILHRLRHELEGLES